MYETRIQHYLLLYKVLIFSEKTKHLLNLSQRKKRKHSRKGKNSKINISAQKKHAEELCRTTEKTQMRQVISCITIIILY